MSFPGGSVIKDLPPSAGDEGSTPGSGRSPGEENGNPLLYSCLENRMDRGNWLATVHRIAKESDTAYQLNNNINRESTSKWYSHQRTVNFAMREEK